MSLFRKVCVLFFLSLSAVHAEVEELQRIDYSGYFRSRFWSFHSQNYLENKFPAGKSVHLYYPDLFFRNRFSINVNQRIKIVTFMDIGSNYGFDGFKLGDGTNYIKVAQLYGRFESIKDLFITIGLQPFALPSGILLAADGSGAKVQRAFLNSNLQISGAMVFAYDESTASFSDTSDSYPGSNKRDDIGFFNSQYTVPNLARVSAYYLVQADNYTSGSSVDPFDEDNKKTRLNWFGTQLKLYLGNFLLDSHLIANKGSVTLHSYSNNLEVQDRYEIEAGFASVGLSYSSLVYSLQLAVEGWSGDPRDRYAKDSFQVIKPSHTFSALTLDSSGGVGLRSGGGSGYGYHLAKVKFSYFFPILLDTQFTYALVRSNRKLTYGNDTSSMIGHSADIYFSQEMPSKSRLFGQWSGLWPAKGYRSISNSYGLKPIFEIMLGVQVDF